ncbi:5-formyltetrahydrofolate cyclo-ligase [Phycicoccus ginsengisoli]
MAGATKDAERRRLAALRRERVPGRDRAKDAESLELAALEVAYAEGLGRGDWVAAYESMPSEPPTESLVAALAARGIRVMVPVTLPDWDLDWHEAGDVQLLGRDAIATARVVFVPAQAVDRHGTRLGRGKGCYDRALARTTARTVAVVHPWEVLDEALPAEPHDHRIEAAITAEQGFVPLSG